MNRRHFVSLAAAASLAPGLLLARDRVRIGVTPVFLDDQTFLNQWRSYLERQLERPVRFVQRGSYREITELVRSNHLDFAWLCGYPYVRYREQLRLLLVPIYEGQPLYRSLLLVPSGDDRTRSLADLRARVFAYSDPLSNSGWLVTQAQLLDAGEDPERFFGRTFFAGAHRNVVRAVAVGLAQGGAVDSYVFEALGRMHPQVTRGTRVVWRSKPFGFPPVVASRGVSADLRTAFTTTLCGMAADPDGRDLLQQFYLDGFEVPRPGLYADIERLMRRVEGV